jgi:hypothetical protein
MDGAVLGSLSASAGQVVLTSEGEVPDWLWRSLGSTIAPGAHDYQGGELLVPVRRLVATSTHIRDRLARAECDFRVDADLQRAFNIAEQDRAQLMGLLGQTPSSADLEAVSSDLSDAGWARKLEPFQERDLARLILLAHGANFSVPGAGKTTVSYAVHAVERARGRVERLLVVAPLSAFEAWEDDARGCFDLPPAVHRLLDSPPPSGADVVLTSYQRLVARFSIVAEWVGDARTHVILDEAHRMKRGATGEWGSACLDIAGSAARRDILTGTPAPNLPRDLGPQFEFLWWPTRAEQILPTAAFDSLPSTGAMADVARQIAPLFVRTNKSELELPPVDRRTDYVQMGPVQRKIYDGLRSRIALKEVASYVKRERLGEIADVLVYLLAAATNPGLLIGPFSGGSRSPLLLPSLVLSGSEDLGDLIAGYRELEMPAKYEHLARLINENASQGRKTLVWSSFVDNLKDLAEDLLAPYEPALIHGGVPLDTDDPADATRAKELRRFRLDESCQVLIANPASMAEGVSLHHECHDAIYLDRNFNAGQYLQSVDRIHRLGLPPNQATRITFLESERSIDNLVAQRIQLKAARLSAILSDPGLAKVALPDEEVIAAPFETSDALALLEHLERPRPPSE